MRERRRWKRRGGGELGRRLERRGGNKWDKRESW